MCSAAQRIIGMPRAARSRFFLSGAWCWLQPCCGTCRAHSFPSQQCALWEGGKWWYVFYQEPCHWVSRFLRAPLCYPVAMSTLGNIELLLGKLRKSDWQLFVSSQLPALPPGTSTSQDGGCWWTLSILSSSLTDMDHMDQGRGPPPA